MKTIEDRADVYKLVTTFYANVRTDALLGPIFNHHLTDEQWPPHLNKLTDFWVTNLFGEVCFKGNPSLAHQKVDKYLNHKMEQHHFTQWLELWFKTIDSLFVGEHANRAKEASKRMAMGQLANVCRSREQL